MPSSRAFDTFIYSPAKLSHEALSQVFMQTCVEGESNDRRD